MIPVCKRLLAGTWPILQKVWSIGRTKTVVSASPSSRPSDGRLFLLLPPYGVGCGGSPWAMEPECGIAAGTRGSQVTESALVRRPGRTQAPYWSSMRRSRVKST
jgi:hypothetical protein